MNKYLIHILFFVLFAKGIHAQEPALDTLRHEIEIAKNDTTKISLLHTITEVYREGSLESSVYYGTEMLRLSRQLKFKLDEGYALAQLGYTYTNAGNYSRSLQALDSALALGEDPRNEGNILPDRYIDQKEFSRNPVTAHMLRLSLLSRVHQYLAILYDNVNSFSKAKIHNFQAREYAEQTDFIFGIVGSNITLGKLYTSYNNLDSAFFYEQIAYDQSLRFGFRKYLGSILLNLGRIQMARGKREVATDYFLRAIDESKAQNYLRGAAAANLALSDLYRRAGRNDSTIYYANEALKVALSLNAPNLLLRVDTTMAGYYRSIHNKDSILKYQELIIKMNDSIFNAKNTQKFENIYFDQQQRQQQIEEAKSAYRVKIRMYLLIGGLAIFLLLAGILWRNNRQRSKANALLSRQKEELQTTLTKLKTTQKQLIQSEKMASLGEVTAGIAHEIQNPLNFVNNFSEVNKELIGEMKLEIAKGNLEEVRAIAIDIEGNEDKISHHGKRADAIVKGMLQHSKLSAGQMEPTDINSLADEYLRLAYHGFRAKDPAFTAMLKTDFDKSIGRIKIIPQDIGRVLLNLLNNAFYAVSEKKKLDGNQFEPEVSLSTEKINGWIEISVRDNGDGVPSKILDKIFQPFFTTKPAGLGTGLGLSFSYDIVKSYGGEIRLESKPGEGTEFVIVIPAQT